MINQETVQKMIDMRLSAMADAFRYQQQNSKDYHSLSFEDRLGMLIDSEWSRRKSNHLTKLIKDSKLHTPNAAIEDIDYHADRQIDRAQLLRLATCSYITDKNNIILMGSTGSGKTYIACALGIAACRKSYSVRYIRLPDLLAELDVARGHGVFAKTIKQYKKVSLLILDEWLLTPLTEVEARDLLEIVEARHSVASTIFCSQFASAGWRDKIGEETIAEAIMDRIVHNAYEITIHSKESMRKKMATIEK